MLAYRFLDTIRDPNNASPNDAVRHIQLVPKREWVALLWHDRYIYYLQSWRKCCHHRWGAGTVWILPDPSSRRRRRCRLRRHLVKEGADVGFVDRAWLLPSHPHRVAYIPWWLYENRHTWWCLLLMALIEKRHFHARIAWEMKMRHPPVQTSRREAVIDLGSSLSR